MTDLDTQSENKNILLRALEMLDEKLYEQKADPLDIRIVGGFALIMQGIRESGFTQDIDSMTRGFSAETTRTIAQIGKELEIKLGWLNADMVLDDPEIIEDVVGEVKFEPYGKYRVLRVSLADLPTLLRLKIVAAGDNLEITGDRIEFERHFADVKALMKALAIKTPERLLAVAPLIEDYPELAGRLF
ncbi:MAG: hypothetical protein LBG81_06510 [Coriobacteriaceae bacterium]|jgi:hypothetical protein|nr:hypothetical protein [Coriobacteriaceae bacterium]